MGLRMQLWLQRHLTPITNVDWPSCLSLLHSLTVIFQKDLVHKFWGHDLSPKLT